MVIWVTIGFISFYPLLFHIWHTSYILLASATLIESFVRVTRIRRIAKNTFSQIWHSLEKATEVS